MTSGICFPYLIYLRMKKGKQDKSANNLIACNLEIEKLNIK